MNLKIAVLAGDGMGPEVVLQAKKSICAIGVVFDHEFILKTLLLDKYIEKLESITRTNFKLF
jgi:3-isopropylmalate dehydrogenase